MSSPLVSRLLEAIGEEERLLAMRAEDPNAGLSDDEMHELCSHPAYEYRTTEGPRKTWDGADTPPDGDGWERNVTTRDPDGWVRLDYTEESYWRRLDPDGPQPPWRPSAEVERGLRLCQAHREIVEHCQQSIDAWRKDATADGDCAVTDLAHVLRLLATAYGIQEGT